MTFNNFLTATKITSDEDKYRMLINFINPTVYSYISDHKSYPPAIKALQDIYDKPRNSLYARHLLASTKQQPHQSLDEYLRTLRTLSKDCDFKPVNAEEYRSESIRDSFISGLSSNFIRQRILESETSTLDTAFNLARTLDLAQRNAESYHSHSLPISSSVTEGCGWVGETSGKQGAQVVSAAIQPKFKPNRQKCYFCGHPRHPRRECPAREDTCSKCGITGHWSKVCHSGSEHASALVLPHMPRLSTLASAKDSYNPILLEEVVIDGHKAEALLDSGANGNFMDKKYAETHKFTIIPANYSVGLASGAHSSKVVGVCFVTLLVKKQKYQNVRMSILSELVSDIILGESFMSLHSSVEFKFGGIKPSLVISTLSPMDVVLPTMFPNLDQSVRPIAIRSRRFSSEDKAFIKLETRRLLENQVIEPSHSPWRAQVLVDRKEGKSPRVVIDYSRTINRYTIPDSYPLPRIEDIVNALAQHEVFTTLDLRSAYHQILLSESDKPFTSFEADGKLYQFKRLPFGLTNAVAAFQRVMDRIVEENRLEGVYVYMDNITVAGQSQEQHDTNLGKFLEVAKKKNLTFNDGKTIYNSTTITLLGYEISKGILKPDQDRVQPLLELPVPHNTPSLKRVIGLFAYYARWIPNYSDNIRPLLQSKSFPLEEGAAQAFNKLKSILADAALQSMDENVPFTVETDASNFCLSATLNQGGRPVAFHSRTMSGSELHQSAVEKEAAAIVDAVRKWHHLLANKHFTLITDQRSVSYMFDKEHSNSIKNNKLMRWRLELAAYKYSIIYRPGDKNAAADTLTRAFCGAVVNDEKLHEIHDSLCHPGITRTLHFIRTRNLPYSTDDVKRVISKCKVCAEVKPRFYRPLNSPLIQATRPWQRLNMDFKGPLPSSGLNKYFLTVVDEYSRYPFAFPCKDMTGSTIILCLTQIFTLFGMPEYVHSDRGSNFLSAEVTGYLHSLGVATCKTTPYNPQGNGQCERFNGTIWQTVQLALKSRGLPISRWELVISEALHSIRSLLCTAINSSPHDRVFTFSRKASAGSALPDWLTTPGAKVLMKRHDRNSKYEPLTEQVELVNCNPQYAQVRLPDGRETTVSLRDLAPFGDGTSIVEPDPEEPVADNDYPGDHEVTDDPFDNSLVVEAPTLHPDVTVSEPRRSTRERHEPDWLGINKR